MKTLTIYLSTAVVALCPLARADEPAIVAKARAYLGAESALQSVTSVHMAGTMSTDLDNSGKPVKISVDIVFQKPWQESITIFEPNRIVHTSLDTYEGSQQSQDIASASQTSIDSHKPWRLTILGPEQVMTLRVDILENLWFYRGVLRVGGTIEDRGPATIEGVATEKVAFVYSPTFVYYRYFDLSSGRLVFSESESGTKLRESGEITAGGIRFPKRIEVTEILGGKQSTKAYEFDKITVNESFPSSLFAVPDLPTPSH
jgi:hypothetical protein